jgi:hypothetical protein
MIDESKGEKIPKGRGAVARDSAAWRESKFLLLYCASILVQKKWRPMAPCGSTRKRRTRLQDKILSIQIQWEERWVRWPSIVANETTELRPHPMWYIIIRNCCRARENADFDRFEVPIRKKWGEFLHSSLPRYHFTTSRIVGANGAE